jgi:solute carrier family 25 (mitochondrial carnitine/acylcarnitine transporter), member 20/29
MTIESFIAGFFYGGTTVLVGQPLDTIKTLQQDSNLKKGLTIPQIARQLYASGGIPAFYRGGLPLVMGGGLMRSAQFGVYASTLDLTIHYHGGGQKTQPHQRLLFGLIDPQVVVAGICGGIGRGLVESPFEMVKVRRQVQTTWTMRELLKGSGTTILRNSFLFSSFVVYIDISKQYVTLSPFWLGGICSNLAWLTFWPLDVVKSRLQSGHYEGKGLWQVLVETQRSGQLYRGLVPGLSRSFLANGISMEVYNWVETELKKRKASMA